MCIGWMAVWVGDAAMPPVVLCDTVCTSMQCMRRVMGMHTTAHARTYTGCSGGDMGVRAGFVLS